MTLLLLEDYSLRPCSLTFRSATRLLFVSDESPAPKHSRTVLHYILRDIIYWIPPVTVPVAACLLDLHLCGVRDSESLPSTTMHSRFQARQSPLG